MISNDGRMVCAVVCFAPETMPSASPSCTIIVPKYETSVTVSRGELDRHALVARGGGCTPRRSVRAARGRTGDTSCAASRSSPSSVARVRIGRGVAEDGERRRPGAAAGWRRRGGCGRRRPRAGRCACRSSRARSSRPCSNMSGVTTPDGRELRGGAAARRRRRAARTGRSARSALRGESAARRPRVWVMPERGVVGAEVVRARSAGELDSPSSSRVICGASLEPAVQDDAGQAREGLRTGWRAASR